MKDIQQAMNAQISLLVIALFFVQALKPNLVCAATPTTNSTKDSISVQNSNSSWSCGDTYTEHSIQEDTKKDKENIVFGEYCLYSYYQYSNNVEKIAWLLVRTEQFMPMPNIAIDVECIKSYFCSVDVSNISGKIIMSTVYFKEMMACGANYACGYDINKEYKIEEDFATIFTMVNDSIQALSLIGKIFPFRWRMESTCQEKKLYDISGIFDIKISGFCNEEQLKNEKVIKYLEDFRKDASIPVRFKE